MAGQYELVRGWRTPKNNTRQVLMHFQRDVPNLIRANLSVRLSYVCTLPNSTAWDPSLYIRIHTQCGPRFKAYHVNHTRHSFSCQPRHPGITYPSGLNQSTLVLCSNVHHCRTVWNIIWSCLVTIFSCTWVAVHPNIPNAEEKWFMTALRRLQLVMDP